LAEYRWSHFCYSPLISRFSVGRVPMVTLRLLSTHHPWISWLSTAGKTSVTLQSSPMDQVAEYTWSNFAYSPLIIRGSSGRAQLVTPRKLFTHNPRTSFQSTAGQTSVTLHSSSVGQRAEHSWSHFGYSSLTTRGSAGRAQQVTLSLFSTHQLWVSWQCTTGHTSITRNS
jgi:hypothetical protein